jgi:hypothetical protein
MGCRADTQPTIHGYRWSAAGFLEMARAEGWSRKEIADESTGHAQSHWRYANLGEVWGRLGFLWDRCPHWYVEHSDPELLEMAQEVIDIRRMCKAGAASMMGELTAAGVEALAWTDTFWSHQQAVLEKQRSKANG